MSIEEKDHIFNLKYAMFMEWYDYRISYYNLKGEHTSFCVGVFFTICKIMITPFTLDPDPKIISVNLAVTRFNVQDEINLI